MFVGIEGLSIDDSKVIDIDELVKKPKLKLILKIKHPQENQVKHAAPKPQSPI